MVATFIVGCCFLILGFGLLNYAGMRNDEIPAVIAAAGFALVFFAILQRMFRSSKLPTTALMAGLIILCFPTMLVWKAAWNPWWALSIVVGLIVIILGVCKRTRGAT